MSYSDDLLIGKLNIWKSAYLNSRRQNCYEKNLKERLVLNFNQ
jgi:hypothetical protein